MTGNLLVEFVGLPGSGKSTLAREVINTLRLQGAMARESNGPLIYSGRILSAVRRVAMATEFIFRYPRLAFQSAAEILSSNQRTWGDARAVTISWLCKCELMARMEKGRGIHISDEGALHAVWCISYSARRKVTVDRMAGAIREFLPGRWLIVFVEAGQDVSLNRLRTRKARKNRLVRDVETTSSAAFQKAVASMNPVRSVLDTMNQGPNGSEISTIFLENNREADLIPNCERVCQAIFELAGDTGVMKEG